MILEKPPVTEALSAFHSSLRLGALIVLIGECSVEYSGRAKSELGPGERLLIIKQDGSVQIHRSVGYEPVNWQPPGSSLTGRVTDAGQLEIKAVRARPREALTVRFKEVHIFLSSTLVDEAQFNLYVTEDEMRDAIVKKPELLSRDFRPIEYERKVKPGFIDVFGMDSKETLVVVEVKRTAATRDAVLQLKRYVDALRKEEGRPVKGVLAAPSLKRGTQTLLASLGLQYTQISPSECRIALESSKRRSLTEYL